MADTVVTTCLPVPEDTPDFAPGTMTYRASKQVGQLEPGDK